MTIVESVRRTEGWPDRDSAGHGGRVKSTHWCRLFGGLILSAALVPAVLAADEPQPTPAPTPAPTPPTETTVDPMKGFVTFKSGENSMTLGAWGQFRMTVDDREDYSAD